MGPFGMMNDPKQMGMLMAAAQIMAQSGPSARPVGIGEILGGGMGAYMNTKNAMTQQQADEEERKQAQEYRGMQMQGVRQQQETAQQALVRAQALQAHMAKRGQGAPMQESLPAPQQGAVPTPMQSPMQPQATPQPQESPYQRHMSMAEHLRAGDFHAEADAEEDRAIKFMPQVDKWQPVQVGEKIMLKPYFKDGSTGSPVEQAIAEKLEWRDSGGSYEGRDSYTGKTITTQRKTQTPDSAATATTAANRLAFDKQQAAAPIFNADAGAFVSRPTKQNPSGSVMPIEGFNRAGRVVAEQEAKRASAAKALLPVIDQAEKLIDGATGSYAGAGIDQAARFFGKSTDGAKATAQLKVLEGQIMMSQPRMEGPQSNMDMQLYRQMAALIGDPTTPRDTKKSALGTLRELHSRYAVGQQGGASGDWQPQAGAPSIDALLDKYGR